MTAEQTGIQFSNRIIENDTMNILNFEYVYNGGGVGIADFNNDGLQDVFFSGNQVDNKLYLNKGNFKFEDISGTANINVKDRWCAGVVTVDINGDGLMDVYVAATVMKPEDQRQNLLFVNQGIENGKPTFLEKGAEYGINDSGHSENAAFFDYDNDGDLDLYVLTNIVDQYPNVYRSKVTDGSYPNTDRLYRCEWSEELKHPIYKNVSNEAGITIEGYGLGLNICDINKDGWKDIYVTNDFAADDLLYINNQNGTFTDQAKSYFKHTSNSAMGNDIADINNDGFLDIVAVDMLAKSNDRKKVLAPPFNYQLYNFSDEFGYIYQYMRNTLQLNNGIDKKNNPMFSEISFLAGFAETDWSWTPSLADFDNDGKRDLLITNGFPKDVTDRDFMAYQSETRNLVSRFELLTQIPEVKISNYAFKNNGDLGFEDVTEKWGLNIPSFSNGAVYADLDNDGDLDYIVNNINDSAFVYKNTLLDKKNLTDKHFLRLKFEGNKQNINGIGTVVEVYFADGEKMIHENNPQRGYLSSVEPIMQFGLGSKIIKSVKVHWYNGKMQILEKPTIDKLLKINIKDAALDSDLGITPIENILFTDISDSVGIKFVHQETDFIDFNYQNLLPFKLSELGPGMSVGDVNNDGLEDVYIGGPKGKSGTLLIQNKNGLFNQQYLLGKLEISNKLGDDLGSILLDFDGDGDLDLYICRGGYEANINSPSYQDVVYVNDGAGNFTENTAALPQFYESSSCVRAADIDKDGDLDLVVSGRNLPSEYPKFVTTRILRNDSKNGGIKFNDITKNIAPELQEVGLVCDILFTDFNGDGWKDLILAGEWDGIKILENKKGTFKLIQNSGLEGLKGLWSSLNGADFDQDGDIDYIAGNVGNNNIYKATDNEPVKLIAKDFDNNGIYDLIPFVYFKTDKNNKKLVPYNSRDDVNKQLNSIRARFVSYKKFAEADYENLLTKEEKSGAQDLTLNFTNSIYIENLGGGKFKYKVLPITCQFSTVLGIQIQDFDKDGFDDVLISGNNYGNEITMGRYDASNGVFLRGNGKGDFKELKNTGFYVPHNAKSSVYLFNQKNEMLVLAAQNRGELKFFKTNISKNNLQIKPTHNAVSYTLNNKNIIREIYLGSSYLGQSSIYQSIPAKATNIKLR